MGRQKKKEDGFTSQVFRLNGRKKKKTHMCRRGFGKSAATKLRKSLNEVSEPPERLKNQLEM